MTEDMRERFEKWAQGPELSLKRDGRFESAVYCEYLTHLAWMAWQAALSSAGTSAGDYDQKSCDVIMNLAMLVRRLCARLHKHEPDAKMIDQALGYLRGEGLQGSILRGDSLSGKGEATLGTCSVLHPIGADDAHEKSDTCIDWKPVKGATDRAEELARKIVELVNDENGTGWDERFDNRIIAAVASLLRREMAAAPPREGG